MSLKTMGMLKALTRRPGLGRRRGFTLACAIAFAALVASAGPASAHAELVGSTPGGGTVVGTEPAQVTLRFSEEIVLKLSAVKVIGPDGRRLDAGPPAEGPSGEDSLAVGLAPDPGHGTFVVEWQVTAADDGHASSGDVMFAVGAPSATPVTVAVTGHDRVTSAVFDAAEWTGFAGLALVGGFAALRIRRTQPDTSDIPDTSDAPDTGETPDTGDVGESCSPRTWPAALGWTVLLAATLTQLATYAPAARGLALTHVLDRSLLSATLVTREGHALMARLVVLALAAIVGDAVLRRARGPVVPVVFTLAVAATWGMTGHAATGSAVPLSVASLTVHVAAMALWVGGLFTVALLLLRGGDGDSPVAEVVARFSRLALVAVALVVATGLYQAWREVGHISALTGTTYGRLLLAKVAVLLVVVGVARRSRGLVIRWRSGSEAALRGSVLIELAGAAVLLLLAVLLAGNAPAREAAGGRSQTGVTCVAICENGATRGAAAT
jgi:copper transport protein